MKHCFVFPPGASRQFLRWNLDFDASLRSLRSDSKEKMSEKYTHTLMIHFDALGSSRVILEGTGWEDDNTCHGPACAARTLRHPVKPRRAFR